MVSSSSSVTVTGIGLIGAFSVTVALSAVITGRLVSGVSTLSKIPAGVVTRLPNAL